MRGNILIVEDEDNLRQALTRAHEREGYTVTQAANGLVALQLLEQHHTASHGYDVVLTDIMMGEISGVDVTVAARKLPDPPEVILLTGYGSLETAITAIRAGAFDYQQKPCPMTTLLACVSSAIEHRQQRQKLLMQARALGIISNVIEHYQGNGNEAIPSDSSEQQDTAKPEDDRYLSVGAIVIDTYQHKVWFDKEPIPLTPTEYEIVTCLARTPGQVRTYSDILREISGQNSEASDAHNIIRQHIRNLRKKFPSRYFENVYRVGYMLIVPDQPTDDPKTETDPNLSPDQDDDG